MHSEIIPFHVPVRETSALLNVKEAFEDDNSLYKGKFAARCKSHMLEKFQCSDAILTASCTDALSMASIVLGLKAGDEVIIPSFTFPSAANAFVNRGIKIVLADSCKDHPNMDPLIIESLITNKTKAIVFMAYGGNSRGIIEISHLAKKHNIWLIEDAAHAYNSTYNGKFVGTYGHVSTFSFHESKMISCGQGGLLVINDPALLKKAKIVEYHGTDKWAFDNGLVSAYNWAGLGAEFNLSEINAAVLFSQLESEEKYKETRLSLFKAYWEKLSVIADGNFILPPLDLENNNGYIFYLLAHNNRQRDHLLSYLADAAIDCAFHYTGLHKSAFYRDNFPQTTLPNCDRFSNCLLRIPIYPSLTLTNLERVIATIYKFYTKDE